MSELNPPETVFQQPDEPNPIVTYDRHLGNHWQLVDTNAQAIGQILQRAGVP